MSLITVEVTQESQRALGIKLDHAAYGVKQGLRDGINAAIIKLANYIKENELSGQLVNNRTGNLRRAVFSRMLTDESGLVGVGQEAPYAVFVNDGTAPHQIVATRAKALRFQLGDKILFRKSVMHPGIKPRQFMEQGLRDMTGEIRSTIESYVRRSVKGSSG